MRFRAASEMLPPKVRLCTLLAASACFAIACAGQAARVPAPTRPAAAEPAPCHAPAEEQARRLLPRARAEALARTTAEAVRDAIAHEDFAVLATYVKERVCLQAQKGGDCRWMSQAELRSCSTQQQREAWQVDTGADDYPQMTCLEAFRHTFFSNPGLASAPPAFNCFAPRADNNASSVVSDQVGGNIYVEFFADDAQLLDTWHPWQSLWLVFQSRGKTVQLLAIQAHYWGI